MFDVLRRKDGKPGLNGPIASDDGSGLSRTLRAMLWLTAIHAVLALVILVYRVANRTGYLAAPHAPIGGDFINLWTTGLLLLNWDLDVIYDPQAFMAFQQDLIGSSIGYRLWAYPPTSLLLAWPWAHFDYVGALIVWSVLGLASLAAATRLCGLSWQETLVVTFSPAALACVYYGQTGNLFAAVMLVALAPKAARFAPIAAALLTIKPQTGFLLSILWLIDRRWRTIVLAVFATLLLIALATACFGTEVWRDYLTMTAPALSKLERHGTGPFMQMIPSLFMSLRLLDTDGDTALTVHAFCAVAVFAVLVWRLVGAREWRTRVALVLLATPLITPYMHNYDLVLILVATLLWHARVSLAGWRGLIASKAVLIAWVAPYLVVALALLGVPIMPVLLFLVLLVVRDEPYVSTLANPRLPARASS